MTWLEEVSSAGRWDRGTGPAVRGSAGAWLWSVSPAPPTGSAWRRPGSLWGRATGWWCTPAAPSAASLRVGAVDPGWVKTKLASRGAPGDVRSGGARVARAAANPDWPGGYTAGARPARLCQPTRPTTASPRVTG